MVTGGRPSSFQGVTYGGSPVLPVPGEREEQGGGFPPRVTPLNDQAESLGTKEKAS